MFSGYKDSETAGFAGEMSAFSEAAVRKGFIRKVYGILTGQLVLTMSIMAVFYIPEVRLYTFQNSWLFWLAFAMTFTCLIALSCCPDVRRKSPANFICLFMFTLAEGFLLGCVGATYRRDEVIMAVGICAVLVIALTLFAFQTKFDFTAMGGILLIGFLILLIISICAIFIRNRILSIIYASIGAFLFSCYLMFDTQLMMGGKHKYALDPEEYVFAALNLYLDIINLFLFILNIIGLARD